MSGYLIYDTDNSGWVGDEQTFSISKTGEALFVKSAGLTTDVMVYQMVGTCDSCARSDVKWETIYRNGTPLKLGPTNNAIWITEPGKFSLGDPTNPPEFSGDVNITAERFKGVDTSLLGKSNSAASGPTVVSVITDPVLVHRFDPPLVDANGNTVTEVPLMWDKFTDGSKSGPYFIHPIAKEITMSNESNFDGTPAVQGTEAHIERLYYNWPQGHHDVVRQVTRMVDGAYDFANSDYVLASTGLPFIVDYDVDGNPVTILTAEHKARLSSELIDVAMGSGAELVVGSTVIVGATDPIYANQLAGFINYDNVKFPQYMVGNVLKDPDSKAHAIVWTTNGVDPLQALVSQRGQTSVGNAFSIKTQAQLENFRMVAIYADGSVVEGADTIRVGIQMYNIDNGKGLS